jgi:spore coat protein A, manganese oxidase
MTHAICKLALLALVAAAPVLADSVTLVANHDNTLIETSDGSLSNGGGQRVFTGRTDQGAGLDKRRALVSFDLSGIPAGSTITGATLSMYMSRTSATAPATVTLRRVLASWGEAASDPNGQEGRGTASRNGDATWLHRFYPTTFWSAPGGDFSSTVSASTSIGTAYQIYTWSAPGMATDVQSWVNNASTNFGWILIGDESAPHTARRFESRETSTASQRPQLMVTFTPPATTGACCLPNGPCVTVTQASCTSQGGTYHGNGSNCSPSPCPPPTGACCFSGAGCSVLTATQCASQGGSYSGDFTSCSPNNCALNLTPFVDALPIVPLAQPTSGVPGGAAHYDMAIRQVQQRFHRDMPMTTVWGYAGMYPGPTILTTSGVPISVTWINDLRDSSGNYRQHHFLAVDPCIDGIDVYGDACRVVTHLHGGHVPASVDGYPTATILPGQSVTYDYPNNQQAGTIWYHDHALGITRLNVYMGLAGFWLVLDPVESALNLPGGQYQIGLAIQDRTFNLDGSLSYPAAWQPDFFGEYIVVNGKVWPYLNVDRGKYRFRLLSGSTARTFTLSLSNGATFWQIGTEGGLLPAPVPVTQLTLMAGERADVVIDFAPYAAGTQIILTNSAPAPYPGYPGDGVVPNVMKFIVGSNAGDTDPLPAALRTVTPIPEGDAVRSRDLQLFKIDDACTGERWTINGMMWDNITEMPRLGDTEVWEFINRSGMSHPMHMHLVMFQVLDRQDFDYIEGQVVPTGPRIPPAAGEQGWKDTVRCDPHQITRVIARFEDYTGRYQYHCHILEHEEHEMMRQFQVVARCGSADFDCDGDIGTDADIESFFACLAGACPAAPCMSSADFNGDGDIGTDADIEAFFRVLAGGAC